MGPAIVASLKLLDNAKAGSMLIMCTDGLSNIGFGNHLIKNFKIYNYNFMLFFTLKYLNE